MKQCWQLGCLGSFPSCWRRSGLWVREAGGGGWDPGHLGSFPFWEGRRIWWVGVGGAGTLDIWVISLALGDEWSLMGQSRGGRDPGHLGYSLALEPEQGPVGDEGITAFRSWSDLFHFSLQR